MKKHFFALALLIAASVASDAATIPAEPSIATDAQIIRQGEGPPKDDGPHQLGHTKASRRLERRGLADKVKASREAEEAKSNAQPPPQMQGKWQQPEPAYGAPEPAYGAHGPAYGAHGPAYGAHGPAYGAPGPAYGAPGPAYVYGRSHGESEYEYAPSAPSDPYGWQPSASSQYETAQHGGRVNNPDRPIIETTLRRIIKHNRLEAFYNEQELQKVLDRLDTVDFNTLGKSVGGIEKGLALDLASLALYDIVFFCDDSGSMVWKDGACAYSRIEDLKVILKAVTEIVLHFDNDGISVRFLNDNKRKAADGIRGEADVEKLIPDPKVDRSMFAGLTKLGTNFNQKVLLPEIVDKAVSNRLNKPVLAIIITDGAPSEDEDIFINNVINAKAAVTKGSRFGPGAFAIEITQVGTDEGAQKYLGRLDNDYRVGNMIDATSNFELEQKEFMEKNNIELTPGLWLVKMCLGAIDPTYDEQDEEQKK